MWRPLRQLRLGGVDELGLVGEAQREFVASLRSSTSAKNGKFLALSILGFGPFLPEIIAQRDQPGTVVHLYQSTEGCAIDDVQEWHRSNPGLACGVKQIEHMKFESQRVLATPSDISYFRSHELNQPQHPAKQMIFDVTAWKACLNEAPRTDACVIGYDLGGSSSMCSLVALFPESGRVECYAAFPAGPMDLLARGQGDGVGSLWSHLHERGELWVYEGRVTNVASFFTDCLRCLDGVTVVSAGADRYRRQEALQFMEEAGIDWPMTWRGTGSSATADGSFDVRSCQAAVGKGELHVSRGAEILTQAIMGASLRFDQAGNPALDKQKGLARIDPLQALVIATGLAALIPEQEASCYVGSAVLA